MVLRQAQLDCQRQRVGVRFLVGPAEAGPACGTPGAIGRGLLWEPGGFHRPLPARERVWKTKTGKANILTPRGLEEDKDMPEIGHDVLRMITLRSNDQFNTTVYGYTDRFRGIHGTRTVVLMNRDDIARMGLAEGEEVTIRRSSKDNVKREMSGFRVTPYNIPSGCVGTYYPEANVLLPLWHYAEGSKTPAAKSVPVRIEGRGRLT
jgi:anaerobic selenocysteine-containing dehydrogenase